MLQQTDNKQFQSITNNMQHMHSSITTHPLFINEFQPNFAKQPIVEYLPILVLLENRHHMYIAPPSDVPHRHAGWDVLH